MPLRPCAGQSGVGTVAVLELLAGTARAQLVAANVAPGGRIVRIELFRWQLQPVVIEILDVHLGQFFIVVEHLFTVAASYALLG